jgi:CHAD domain-containing protein
VSKSPFELDRSEPGTRGVRRIAQQRISKALASLQTRRPSDKVVHSARKELKKSRATLRLLRDSMSDAAYQKENSVLRDAARPLSAIRDGKALLDTLDDLVERYGTVADGLPAEGLKRTLRRDRADARRDVLKHKAVLKPERSALRKTCSRAAKWPVNQDGWKIIGSGLERTYRKGRKALAAAQADATVENLHEWRKQAKYLRHQLQILRPLWPGLIGELADQAHKLTEYLGEGHDLAVLRDKALGSREPVADDAELSALIALIDRRRAELRDKAFVLGDRIYEEKPKAFAARFGQYWDDWRKQADGRQLQPRSR